MAGEIMYSYDDINYDMSVLDYGNINETLDYKNIPYLGEIKKVPLYEIVLKSYLYAMIIFFSLVGNTLIIVVVLRHKQMRTTTNFYIVNLAVADILVTIFCTWVHLVNNLNNNNWVLGGFFCKFNTFSQVLCLIASVLSLTLIAYDRFFGIVFALKAHMSSRKARFSIGIIWLCSFVIAAPLLWFRELKERQWLDYTERWCDDTWPVETKIIPGSNYTVQYMPSRTIYFTFVSAVLYFFPMIVMTIAYSVIIRKLRSSTIPGERVNAGFEAQQKTKRKVIAMLVTIMAVFGVCWLPYQIVLLYSELRETRERLGEWYFTMQFLAGCFAYSNSALNPLIYAGFNKNFKQGLFNLRKGMDYSRRLSGYTAMHIRQTFTRNRHSTKSTTSTSSGRTICKRIERTPELSIRRGLSIDSCALLLGAPSLFETAYPSQQLLCQIRQKRLEAERLAAESSTPAIFRPSQSFCTASEENDNSRYYEERDKVHVFIPIRRSHSFNILSDIKSA